MEVAFKGSGIWVFGREDLGFRVWGLCFWFLNLGISNKGLGFGSGFRVQCFGVRGLGFGGLFILVS